MIDLEFIERLMRTLDESGLDHVEIERGGTRVRVSKSPPQRSAEPRSGNEEGPAREAATDQAVESSKAVETAPKAVETKESEPKEEDGVEIVSPMVGTFYRSASPGADPFTEVGAIVSPGDVLCIIEAMKLMNELEAEMRGEIREICVGDGEPVEYGQVLFRLRPS